MATKKQEKTHDICPECGKEKPIGVYLCWDCWATVPIKEAKTLIKAYKEKG